MYQILSDNTKDMKHIYTKTYIFAHKTVKQSFMYTKSLVFLHITQKTGNVLVKDNAKVCKKKGQCKTAPLQLYILPGVGFNFGL